MRLKTLEIKGFKSFANQTVIHFGEDVIGIVGPNGSGKSNIVDAVRWVLGEQKTTELRLDRMSNVIFNGTKKKKKSPLARVSLTFENSKNILPVDYQTVTISRTLYQSGDSEYKLNDVQCRLKDITSLFLDTGIGADSYAIIALNMVEDILNDNENSRLRMLEQAAGISKYKVRKRQTLNKLKSTTEDLDRVEDLLFEIENNLKELEKQARKTKRYFQIKEKYKELSLQLARLKVGTYKIRQNEIRDKLEKEQDKYRQYNSESDKLEAKLEAERKTNLDKEKALSERQRELNALVGEIRSKENERSMSEQRMEFIQQNIRKLNLQIETSSGKRTELTAKIERYSLQLNEEKLQEVELEKLLEDSEKYLKHVESSHGTAKTDLDEMLTVQQAHEKELYELEKQKAINFNRLENLLHEIEQNDSTNFQRKLELKELKKNVAEIEAKEKKEQEQLTFLEKAAEERKEALVKLEEEAEALQKKVQDVNRKLDAKKNEFQLTQSMVENLEGFPESIKFLSNLQDWSKNAPLFSDLLYVSEEYRVAIENYLEPYLNYYVVQSVEEAYNAIKLLNKSQKGKANFFILDAFENYEPPMALLPGTVSAVELVEVEPAFRKLCSYLLEGVLVTDNEDLAKVQQEGNYVILSKSGYFIKRRFSITGGSIGLFEGKKIGRKKNLEMLETSIRKLEVQGEKESAKFFDVKTKIQQKKAERDERKIQLVREELARVSQQKYSFISRRESLQQLLEEFGNKNEKLGTEIQALKKINIEIDQALEEKSEEVLSAKKKISDVGSSYREISDQLTKASSSFNEKNISFIRQQNKVSVLQREHTFFENQLSELTAGIENDKKGLEDSVEEIGMIDKKIVVLEAELNQAYENRKEKESLLTEAEKGYFKARGGINEIEDSLRELNKSRHFAQILINELKDKFNDVRIEATSLIERLRVEFKVDVKKLLEEDSPEESEQPSSEANGEAEEELQQKVERMKNRIDNYGEINPMAVEAFEAMKERYDSIVTQRDDILAAKESLLETIKEIEETATSQFLEAFDKARLYFIEVFRGLFTEDDAADLILLNPDSPLESKIEIIAKPKGKRPQTINQLSGGEKTLTATALLFALYLLKPAPFCIFDEVDAPLDDANIEKFNRLIKKFSKDSQFIIVTHNKLTMAAVNVIYGVYMAEQGVSAVSPVDFREYEHRSVLQATG